MVMTIGKQLDAIEHYCQRTSCGDCKILDENYDCKLGDVEDSVKELFETVFGLDALCTEIEKAGRSANQSAK